VVALHGAGHQVLGLDLAPSALAEARALYGEPEGMTWIEGDFFDSALAAAHPVSAIFEHTCFCAIRPERREDFAAAAAQWLIPGGRLVAVFFLDPPSRPNGEAGPPFGARKGEIRSLFEGAFALESEGIPKRSHPDREGREWVVEFVRRR
jgi:hypothetical protein